MRQRALSKLYAEAEQWEKRMVYAFHKWETYRKTIRRLERKADKEILSTPFNDPLPELDK